MSVSSAVRAHLGFALAVHRALAGHGGDSCYSPYSVASALGLVTRAARGATAAEPATLLAGSFEGTGEQAELLRKATVLDAHGSGEQPTLAVSNTLWVWQGLPVNPDFSRELTAWPSGGMSTAPFPEDPEGTRAAINADVARTTRDLIPQLLPPGTIGSDMVAGIVNALYLRAAWSYPFRTGDTAPGEFHAPSGPRQVPMMRQSETLGYAAHAGWQLVDLPAVGGVDAVVLLPDRSLAEQEPDLDVTVLAGLLSAKRDTRVTLAMPRLSLDVRSALKPALLSLGVRRMFEPSADFGELSDDPRLLVSDVLHEAVLRIDENGLEGAAATAAMMRLVSMPAGQPVTVVLDRPFLLLVRHAGTGAVYFLARVVEP